MKYKFEVPPPPPEGHAYCDICGHVGPLTEMNKIPAIGWMHKVNSVCKDNLKADGFESALQRAVGVSKRIFGKPRDPDRIDEVLQEIERIWRKHPDLRLTQLIANVLPGQSPHYNIEDSDLLENLRRVYP